MTGFNDEDDTPITLEEVIQILDDADSLYDEDKTFNNALFRLTTYVSNMSQLHFVEMIGPLTRFLKLLSDDWITQNILSSDPSFRDAIHGKINEMEDKYGPSDLPEVPELMEQIEIIKHIIDEIENHFLEDEVLEDEHITLFSDDSSDDDTSSSLFSDNSSDDDPSW